MATSKKTVKPSLGKDTWQSYDGKVMPWSDKPVQGQKKPKAVVITVHGLSGAAMDFWMLEDEWPRRNVAVCGMQLRGQGNDPVKRDRGNVSSAKVWQKDLVTFHQLVRERYPGVPVFWYSESLGTLIALHAITSQMPDSSQWPAGIVMSSPAAGLRLRPKGLRATMLNTAIATMPFIRVNLERLGGVNDKDIRVTHDTTHGAQMAITSHYVSHFSLRLLGEVDLMMRTVPAAAPQVQVPVLMLASPNDVIASEEQIRAFFEILGSHDKTIHWYLESYHLLLHDTQRQQVLKDATEWVESRAGSARP
ncbi:serine aminopeptidase domain-containing protein [Roseimicrobium gellanilyticum]|nr:alpha/beta hydrolase [Roseimicrobium gellanilyticum]